MATLGIDIIRKTVSERGLSEVVVYNGTTKGGNVFLQSQGTIEEALTVLDQCRDHGSGYVCIVARKPGVKGTVQEWTCNLGGGTVGAMGGPGIGSNYIERYYEAKLDLERERLQREYDQGGDRMDKLIGVLEKYAPIVAHSMGIVLPGTKVVGRTDDPDDIDDPEEEEVEEEPVGGLPKEELEALLIKVAKYARKNPDAARSYAKMIPDE